MPLSKTFTSPNGAVLAFHRVAKMEVSADGVAAAVQSWGSEAAWAAGFPPLWTSYVSLGDASAMLTAAEKQVPGVLGALTGAVYVLDSTTGLDNLKLRKNAEINAARLNANQSGFIYGGHLIATDTLSRGDIDAANGSIALNDAMPANWPGAWKADDNAYVPILDMATWKAFYAAMVAAGNANFAKSQTLKTTLAAATTAEQVAAIVWPA